jgi:hypothetical protein
MTITADILDHLGRPIGVATFNLPTAEAARFRMRYVGPQNVLPVHLTNISPPTVDELAVAPGCWYRRRLRSRDPIHQSTEVFSIVSPSGREWGTYWSLVELQRACAAIGLRLIGDYDLRPQIKRRWWESDHQLLVKANPFLLRILQRLAPAATVAACSLIYPRGYPPQRCPIACKTAWLQDAVFKQATFTRCDIVGPDQAIIWRW